MKIILLFLFLSLTCLVNTRKAGRKEKIKSKTIKCHLRKEYWNDKKDPKIVATALLRGQGNFAEKLKSEVKFEQQYYGGPVRITVKVTNADIHRLYGFVILQYGRHHCNKLGGLHFNPTNSAHGKSAWCNRHHGDLEPIKTDHRGQITEFVQWDPRVKLQGPYSVIGRTVAILISEDDEDEDSFRIACGIIGYANNTNFTSNTFHIPSVDDEDFPIYLLATVIMCICIGSAWTIYNHKFLVQLNRFHFEDKNVEYFHQRRIRNMARGHRVFIKRKMTHLNLEEQRRLKLKAQPSLLDEKLCARKNSYCMRANRPGMPSCHGQCLYSFNRVQYKLY